MKVPSLCFVLIALPRILVPDPIGRDNGALHKIFAKALNLHIRDAVQHPVRIEIDAIVLGAPLVPDDVLGLEAVLGQGGTAQQEQLLHIVELHRSAEGGHIEGLHKAKQLTLVVDAKGLPFCTTNLKD